MGLCGTLAWPFASVCVWYYGLERSRTAASVGDGEHAVLKVPVSRPSVLWRSGVAHVALCLVQPETPDFFCYPVEMHKDELLLSSFLTGGIYNIQFFFLSAFILFSADSELCPQKHGPRCRVSISTPSTTWWTQKLGSLALAIAERWLYSGVYYHALFWTNAAYSSWSVHISTPVPLERHRVQGRSGSQASNGQSAGQSEPPGSFQPHHLSHLFLCTVSVAPRLQWTGKKGFWRFCLMKEIRLYYATANLQLSFNWSDTSRKFSQALDACSLVCLLASCSRWRWFWKQCDPISWPDVG